MGHDGHEQRNDHTRRVHRIRGQQQADNVAFQQSDAQRYAADEQHEHAGSAHAFPAQKIVLQNGSRAHQAGVGRRHQGRYQAQAQQQSHGRGQMIADKEHQDIAAVYAVGRRPLPQSYNQKPEPEQHHGRDHRGSPGRRAVARGQIAGKDIRPDKVGCPHQQKQRAQIGPAEAIVEGFHPGQPGADPLTGRGVQPRAGGGHSAEHQGELQSVGAQYRKLAARRGIRDHHQRYGNQQRAGVVQPCQHGKNLRQGRKLGGHDTGPGDGDDQAGESAGLGPHGNARHIGQSAGPHIPNPGRQQPGLKQQPGRPHSQPPEGRKTELKSQIGQAQRGRTTDHGRQQRQRDQTAALATSGDDKFAETSHVPHMIQTHGQHDGGVRQQRDKHG